MSFHDRPLMLILPSRIAVNPPAVDKFDAGFYDSPAWKRLGKPDPMRELVTPLTPLFLRKQAG